MLGHKFIFSSLQKSIEKNHSKMWGWRGERCLGCRWYIGCWEMGVEWGELLKMSKRGAEWKKKVGKQKNLKRW